MLPSLLRYGCTIFFHLKKSNSGLIQCLFDYIRKRLNCSIDSANWRSLECGSHFTRNRQYTYPKSFLQCHRPWSSIMFKLTVRIEMTSLENFNLASEILSKHSKDSIIIILPFVLNFCYCYFMNNFFLTVNVNNCCHVRFSLSQNSSWNSVQL